jgi:hypothetical protein
VALASRAAAGVTLMINGLRAATVATWEWTAAILANPIGAIIAAVIALAVGIYLIFKNWQKLADFYELVWAKVKSIFDGGIFSILGALAAFTPLGLLMMAFQQIDAFMSGISWYDHGKALLMGLINGIKSMASQAWDSVTGIATGITKRFKSLLGIASPSRVFLALGANVVAGLARGVQTSQGLAIGRIGQLARLMTAGAAIAAAPTLGLASAAAPATPSVVIQIDYKPQIVVGSNVTAESKAEIEKLLREHSRQLLQLVKEEQRKLDRRKF